MYCVDADSVCVRTNVDAASVLVTVWTGPGTKDVKVIASMVVVIV
jgi:hypothetical protein